MLLQADSKMLLNVCNNGIFILVDISALIKLICSKGRFLIENLNVFCHQKF